MMYQLGPGLVLTHFTRLSIISNYKYEYGHQEGHRSLQFITPFVSEANSSVHMDSAEKLKWILISQHILWSTLKEAIVPCVKLSVSLYHLLSKFLIRAGPLHHYLLVMTNHFLLH